MRVGAAHSSGKLNVSQACYWQKRDFRTLERGPNLHEARVSVLVTGEVGGTQEEVLISTLVIQGGALCNGD